MLFIDEKHDTYTLMESCWWALGGCCSGWQSAGSRHPEMLGKYPLAAPFVFIQIYLFCVQFDMMINIPFRLHVI